MQKHFLVALALFLTASFFVVPGFAHAQKGGDTVNAGNETPQGIFETRREYEEFMGGLKSLRDPEINSMLPALNDLALGRSIGKTARQYDLGGNPVLTLLADKNIRQELEVVDDQIEAIKRLNRELQARLSKEVRSMDLTNAGQVASTIRDITESARSEMEEVFLPHQLDRLKQLGVRNQMNRQGVLGALVSDPLASELEITDEQKDKLQQSAKEIESELAREIEQLKVKARKKLFSNLSREQQQKLDVLIGDEYQFSSAAIGISSRSKGKRDAKEKPKKQNLKYEKPRR